MSRELKRVPLDFDWPMNKIWDGYLNPHYLKCLFCENGYTNARRRLQDLVRLLLLSAGDSLRQKNHPYFYEGVFDDFVPSKDMVELTEGLTGRKPEGPFGYDATANWKAEEKIISAAGLNPKTWGICQTCKGSAIHPARRARYEAWAPTEPPEGKGYQLWENCSEGSPVSPVFKTLDELCEWAEGNAATFGSHKTSKENWKKMLEEGCVYHQQGNAIFM